jgi:hypothetical protein
MISAVAERIDKGESLEGAFARWARNLDALFEKWRRLIEQAFADRCVAPFATAEYERQS